MKASDRRVDIRLPRLAVIAVCTALALLSIFFLTKPDETRAGANLVLGKLAFQSRTIGFSGQPQLTVRTSFGDGAGVTTVAGPTLPSTQPTWSPDGSKIALTVAGASANEIYSINADGSNPVNLTQTPTSGESSPSWSPAGKIIYERDNQVWMMNQDGSNQAQFTAITQASPTGPAFSFDGSKIAFASGGEIWKINADGTGEVRVTNNATVDSDPGWSPDGSKIIFQKGSTGIAVIDASGSNESNLTVVANDRMPAWSSDGTTIAFKRVSTLSGIYVMDFTGGNQTRAIPDASGPFGATNDEPAWQPIAQAPNTFSIIGRISGGGSLPAGAIVSLSGTTNATTTADLLGNYQFSGLPAGGNYTVSAARLNYSFTPPSRTFNSLSSNQIADFVGKEVCFGASCARNGRIAFVAGGAIFSVNPNGSDRRAVTDGTFPNYSPDGSKITFSSTRDGNNEIYQANADGSNPVRLTHNSASDIQPYYSPNGASIVFTSNRDGNDEIYKMNSDGSNQVRLTNEASSDRMPAFAPNGQTIIFVTDRLGGTSSHRLFTMNADGSNQQVISNIDGVYFRPSYRPDGVKIVFGYGQFFGMADIWTMNFDGGNRAMLFSNRVENPSYSPDGASVVYKCCGNIELDINGIHINGSRITQSIADDWPTWQRIFAPRRTAFDFDGDGRSDISVFRPSDRVWYLLRSQAGFLSTQWGLSDDTIAPADYDGDLKTDIAIWRPSEGNYYVLHSFDSTVKIESLGTTGDIPLPNDWDGDSKADLTVYRSGTQGNFYYRASMANPSGSITTLPWGTTGDKPVLGDYDGDGRTDAAIFRPSNRIWYVRKSSDGSLLASGVFGLADDKLVPADYDGDGRTDIAVYRDGVWYLLRSTEGFLAFNYGLASDLPVPADYDGDGRADAAVYRNGIWYRLKSTGGDDVIPFGLTADKPIPAAQIP